MLRYICVNAKVFNLLFVKVIALRNSKRGLFDLKMFGCTPNQCMHINAMLHFAEIWSNSVFPIHLLMATSLTKQRGWNLTHY